MAIYRRLDYHKYHFYVDQSKIMVANNDSFFTGGDNDCWVQSAELTRLRKECQRVSALNMTRFLNIHAYEGNNRQEQVRMFYPVINGACVVSERSARNYMDGCITECPLQYIPETIENILKNDMWKKLGDNAVYNFMRR